ncbi:MAG: PP2C family protein-serine/threonine phosphatase [Anaerolineales bacterium]|jgi:serine phosphatase RsbU (regulator of sigma subunit)
MYDLLYAIAHKFWPELETMSQQRRLVGVGNVIITLITAPLAVGGVIWLILVTDINLISRQWGHLLLFSGLFILFNRIGYFFIVELRTDRYGSADGSLASTIQWTAALLIGPTSLWLSVLGSVASFLWNWRRARTLPARWNQLRGFAMDLAVVTLAYLIALYFYEIWGGVYPIQGLTARSILLALAAMAVYFGIVLVIWTGYIAYAIWIQRSLADIATIQPILWFLLLALGLPNLAHPFAIFLSGLYVENGYFVFLFFIMGLLFVAYLTRQLSWTSESSRQQSRQLEKIESLGRDIIGSPPDASTLHDLLEKHVPTMFPSGRVVIWMPPDQYLLRHPEDWSINVETIWQWVCMKTRPTAFLERDSLPWKTEPNAHNPVLLTPILDVQDANPIGIVYIELRSLSQPWDRRSIRSLFPAVSALADQVATTLHQALIYTDTLDYQSTLQELEFAGRIQASFMPKELPLLDGWELAVSLLPARETSGDFFDFFPLSDGRVGILIADVADKGVGAALYMALSRTLLRTYALEYDVQPDIVFFSANDRIFLDASADLFVTAFYGILDPETGTLTYANAGHNSPFLLSAENGGTIDALTPTGMPIGIDEDTTWTQSNIKMNPGDVLLLYTDGIPDAQNTEGEFFKERQLIEIAQSNFGKPAHELQKSILDGINEFVNGAPQFDDITLLVLARDPNTPNEDEIPPAEQNSQIDMDIS